MIATKENIIALPNAHLRERSRKISLITDDIREIVSNMESATLDWEASRPHEVGVALAAIQIDCAMRIIVVRKDFEDKNDKSFVVFINPKITKYEGKIIEDYEGCLSVPDIYGKVPRYEKVRVKAIDLEGREFRTSAEGFLARVFQHEIDHTNGIVFVDHIKNNKNAFYHLNDEGNLEKLNYDTDICSNKSLFE